MSSPRADVVIPELLQGQWTTALICTYGADLTFFETRLLGQLAQIPLRIVLADDGQLGETLAESARTGQRHRLANKAYVAAPVRHPRAAHGKLIALLGPSSGLLVVGSGNLGYEGYAAPGELWHIYAYSDERPEHLQEFAAARAHVDGLAQRGLLDPPVVELLQTAWSQSPWIPPSPESPSALLSSLEDPIIEQLRAEVDGPVDELIAHAPFHDADCEALRTLIERFQPKRTRLLLTDATSADPASIQNVMSDAPRPVLERVQVKSEPGAYIHAKWVHLIHGDSETLLTGSANLSRTALLRSATNGNVELGVITHGGKGAFNSLYAHLERSKIGDPASLKISYQGAPPGDTVETMAPILLWSRFDGARLTLAFDRSIPKGTSILVEDHAGSPVEWTSIEIDGAEVRLALVRESADRLAEGGRIQVTLDGDDSKSSHSWPYHLAQLRGRLDKAGQRDRLQQVGDLPEQDAELYELLQELDATLIIDRASVWRIAKGNEPAPVAAGGDAQPSISLEDLDWTRVRRDHRYGGYFGRSGGPGVAPTDVQVILASIAGRLGEIGMEAVNPSDGEDELAHEGDTTSSEGEDEREDELEDELLRRRLPVSTRTRMAFDRFSRRYSEALADSGFIEELGPIPAATNAIIFNHLLARLLERNAISPSAALSAQLGTWAFLWGSPDAAGIAEGLDEEAAQVVRRVLRDGHAKVATVRGIAAAADRAATGDDVARLQGLTRFLLVDADFGLDCDLLEETAGLATMAGGLLDALFRAASPASAAEVVQIVTESHGISKGAVHWSRQTVQRAGSKHDVNTFVIESAVEGLTPELAVEMLGSVVVASSFTDHAGAYWRVRFAGNGKSVAFWDGDARDGVVRVEDEIQNIAVLDVPWPAWVRSVDALRREIATRSQAAQSA